MSNIFKNTDTIYKIEGKNIFLMRKEVNRDSSPQQSKKGITGTVIDKNGEPIIGANVLIKGTSIGTLMENIHWKFQKTLLSKFHTSGI